MIHNIHEEKIFVKLTHDIERLIDPEVCQLKHNKGSLLILCQAVRGDIDALLDLSRRAHAEAFNDLELYLEELKSSDSMVGVKLCRNKKRGYYLSLPSRAIQQTFQDIALEVVKHPKNGISFTTQKLASLSGMSNIFFFFMKLHFLFIELIELI